MSKWSNMVKRIGNYSYRKVHRRRPPAMEFIGARGLEKARKVIFKRLRQLDALEQKSALEIQKPGATQAYINRRKRYMKEARSERSALKKNMNKLLKIYNKYEKLYESINI